MRPHPEVGAEGPVAAEQVQLVGLAEVEAASCCATELCALGRWLASGGADPPGDEGGAGQAGVRQCDSQVFVFCWVQAIGEAG